SLSLLYLVTDGTGNLIVSSDHDSDEDDLYKPGDKVAFEIKDSETGKSVKREYEVMAVGEVPDALSKDWIYYFNSDIVIPETEYLSITENRNALSVMINAEEGRYEEVSEKISSVVDPDPDIFVKSVESLRDEFNDFTRMIKIVGGSLCVILGLIGVLNFVNSVVTGIVSRKRELAVMNAVGMTGKQLSSMLMWEGAGYAFLTALVSVTFGTLICYAIIEFVVGNVSFSENYSLVPVLVCIPVLLVLSSMIPATAYRILCRESVVERLREN
ncbi:MAG: ABC transporter permease, partial [Oscillospiraceae bacterium]|nr:ABC transporter permease [Oscillospiraceae bacterium]